MSKRPDVGGDTWYNERANDLWVHDGKQWCVIQDYLDYDQIASALDTAKSELTQEQQDGVQSELTPLNIPTLWEGWEQDAINFEQNKEAYKRAMKFIGK